MLSRTKRAFTTRGLASWLVLVVLFPLSVYAWAPDGLLESWYGPLHVIWAIVCGAGIHAALPGRESLAAEGSAAGERSASCGPSCLRTAVLIACVYGAAGLVALRARGWAPHPATMPGPGSGHPAPGLADAAVFVASGIVAGAIWCAVGKRQAGTRNEGSSC